MRHPDPCHPNNPACECDHMNYKELTAERFDTIESIVEALELADEDFREMLIVLGKPTTLLYCDCYYNHQIYYDLFEFHYETLENLVKRRM